MDAVTIWTIGHSNRTLEQFLELLQSQRIQLLADAAHHPRTGFKADWHVGADFARQERRIALDIDIEIVLERKSGGKSGEYLRRRL